MKISTWRVFSFYLQQARKHAVLGLLMFGAMIISTLTGVAAPWFLKILVDQMAQPGAQDLARAVAITLCIVLGLKLIGVLTQRITSLLSVRFESETMTRISHQAFAYIGHHSYQTFTNEHSGSLTRKINRLRDTFEGVVDTAVFNIIPFIVNSLGVLIVVWLRSPFIAVFLGVFIILFVAVLYAWSMRILDPSVARAAKDSEVSGAMTDSFLNNTTVKLFASNGREENRLFSLLEELKRLQIKSWYLQEYGALAQNIAFFILEAGVMGLAVYYWTQGKTTLGDFVLLQSYLGIIISQFWWLNRMFKQLFRAIADAKEGLELLEMPHGVQDKRRAKELEINKGAIVFDKINFNYNQTRQVFKKFGLKIKAGERIALVGPSGSGKSTLVKLLLRLYDLDGGHILIDGQDIAKVTQDSLRRSIALVPQDPQLFHRTIMENLRYGRQEASDEEIFEAAKLAHCHDFIINLPNGYDSLVGERGIKLSGGERQRVAIARALLADASILVLDEATSSLDSESEALIQVSLRELMKGRTTLAIAHRLSTIMQMDRIIVLDQGKIVDTGTHAELLERQGLYRKLWKIQAGGYEKEKDAELI